MHKNWRYMRSAVHSLSVFVYPNYVVRFHELRFMKAASVLRSHITDCATDDPELDDE